MTMLYAGRSMEHQCQSDLDIYALAIWMAQLGHV